MSREDQASNSPASSSGKLQRDTSDKTTPKSPTSTPLPTKVIASPVPEVETTLSAPAQIEDVPVPAPQPAQILGSPSAGVSSISPQNLPTSPSTPPQNSSQCPLCAVSSSPSKSDKRLMIFSMIPLYVAAFFAWFGKGQAEDMGARLNLLTLGFLIAASVMALVKSKQKKWAVIFGVAGLFLWCIGTVASSNGDLSALAEVFRVF